MKAIRNEAIAANKVIQNQLAEEKRLKEEAKEAKRKEEAEKAAAKKAAGSAIDPTDACLELVMSALAVQPFVYVVISNFAAEVGDPYELRIVPYTWLKVPYRLLLKASPWASAIGHRAATGRRCRWCCKIDISDMDDARVRVVRRDSVIHEKQIECECNAIFFSGA